MTERIIALVPAAGIGARANPTGEASARASAIPKQYRLLRGEPMLRRAVKALLADRRVAEVRVAVSTGDIRADSAVAGLPRTICRPCGGPTRADTVLGALHDAQLEPQDWVLVHDAARPGLPLATLQQLIDRCLNDSVGGLLALPVADTVKGGSERVERTVSRDGLWLAQTPQMFRAGLLQSALENAVAQGLAVTDESSAMEAAGHAPILVRGAARNFKLTWPEDFELMEKWL